MRHFFHAAPLLNICKWSVLRAELDYAVGGHKGGMHLQHI